MQEQKVYANQDLINQMFSQQTVQSDLFESQAKAVEGNQETEQIEAKWSRIPDLEDTNNYRPLKVQIDKPIKREL